MSAYRIGEWFGFQFFDVRPDIITLAKGLCGGILPKLTRTTSFTMLVALVASLLMLTSQSAYGR
ncbi:MAG: hypothetical protein U0930_08675 [Pirellulales bacterium]